MTVIRQLSLLVRVKKTVLDGRTLRPDSLARIGDYLQFGLVVCPLMVDELD
jgi:hypothetical protein